MKIKANYHTHTWRCRHAVGTEREYVEQAIQAGIKILGFSDHTPYIFPDGYYSTFRMKPEELEGYVTTVLDLKNEYAKDIEIHLGLEAEYYPRYFGKLMRFLEDYPIEYLLLGQHFIGNEIDSPYSGNMMRSDACLKEYCDLVIEAMKTGRFLYAAHPDLFNYIGDKETYRKEMQRICEAAKDLHIPLEVNLLGLMEGRNYPNEAFWEMVGKNGNDCILGMDVHSVSSMNIPEVEEEARRNFVEKYQLKLLESLPLER